MIKQENFINFENLFLGFEVLELSKYGIINFRASVVEDGMPEPNDRPIQFIFRSYHITSNQACIQRDEVHVCTKPIFWLLVFLLP